MREGGGGRAGFPPEKEREKTGFSGRKRRRKTRVRDMAGQHKE
jgi:hypothetical protein